MSNLLESLLNIIPPAVKKLQVDTVQDAKRVFALVSLVAGIAEKALIHYHNRELNRFDALVGETQCHIRAFKLLNIGEINGIDERVAQLQQVQEVLFKMHESNQVGSFTVGFEPLTEDELFLVRCHLLYLVRGGPDASLSVSENLRGEVSPELSDSLKVEDLQKTMFRTKELLALETVKTVKEMASQPHLKALVSGGNVLYNSQLARVSSYLGFKIVLDNVISQNKRLLLKVEGGDSVVVNEGSGDAALVIECISQLNSNEIRNLNLYEEFLANGAHHYQFHRNDVQIPTFEKLGLEQFVRRRPDLLNNPQMTQDEAKGLKSLFKSYFPNLCGSKEAILQTFVEMKNHQSRPLNIEIKHIYAESTR